MDSSEEGSDIESPPSLLSRRQQNVKAGKKTTTGTDLAMSENSLLKPKLDTIFAEVERSLPSIDFDLSDVSSDNEEPIIFHRHLKKSDYDYDDDKDLDTSLSGESLSELLPPNSDNLSLKSFTNDDITVPQNTSFDNDMAFYMQQRSKNVAPKNTSWTDVVIEAEGDRPAPRIQNWIDPKEETEESTSEKGEIYYESKSIDIQTDLSDNEEKHEIESTSEKPKKASSVSNVEVNSGDRRMDRLVKKEELRIKEREIVDNVISSRAPRLIMPGLESVDLDTLLNTINEDNQFAPPPIISNMAWPEQRNIEALFAAGEGNNRIEDSSQNTNETLLERLARLSMRQSGEDLLEIDPVTGAPRVTDAEEKDVLQTMNNNNTTKAGNVTMATKQTAYKSAEQVNQSIMKNKSESRTTSCGTNTEDPTEQPRIITPSKYKTKQEPKPSTEPDTVFIDLRNFEKMKQEQQQKIERVQRILNIQPDSSDDSSDSDGESVGLWFEQRQRMKNNMAAKEVSSPALPNKPKVSRTVKPPQRVIPMNHRKKGEDDSNRQESETTTNTESEAEILARKQAEEEEKEKQRKIEEARKLREQREAERQSRLRLSKNLEAVRPTASVSGKQDAAENTPVIFDYDASYEPAPQTLPGILATDQECLLLTIHLSSNGEIVLHRGKTNKSVDTGVGLSASYTVLLTWLLSLVPENFSFLHGRTADQEDRSAMFVPPFYVLGLQQMWLDEHLCLVVAVTPVEQFDARYVPVKSKKTKVKDEMKGSSPFQQHVSKYLSVNTLHSVCPWLQDMVSVEVTSPKKDPSNPKQYIYRPPLPNITTKPLSTFVQVNHDPQAARKVFNSSVGFFFQTVDSDEIFCDQIYNEGSVKYDTQNTMSLVYKKIFCDPRSMMGIFNRILQEGLDLSGVRLLYPTQLLLSLASGQTFPVGDQGDVNVLNNIGPVLAIALRGTFARTIWLDAVGPSDPALARRTDPNSLCALFGGVSREECLLFCPRNITRVHTELTRWFGGRVPPGGVIDVGTPYMRKDHLRSGSPKRGKGKRGQESREEKKVVPPHRPPAGLTATTKNDIFLILSPLVPPKSMGIILSTCQRRGYQIRGIKRSRLTARKCNSLGIDGSVMGAFCPGTSGFDLETTTFTESADQSVKHVEAMAPATFLQIQKENATHSAASLIEAFMIQLTMQGMMNSIQSNTDFDLSSKHLFHAARFSDSLLATLGGDFSKCVDYDIEVNPSSYIVPTLYTNPELEEVVVLLLLGHEVLKTCGLFVGKLLNLVPYSKNPVISTVKDGFELLGIKWLPSLSMSQAKEVTPFEVGDRSWKENIHTLTSEPAFVLVLRSIAAFKKLESVVPKADKKSTHLDFLMSQTAEEAYSFARSFFMDRELFCDPQSRPLLPYLPQSRHLTGAHSSLSMSVMKPELLKESIFEIMQSGPRPLTTFLLIKPRAVKRHLPKILKKIVQEGFHIVGFRLDLLDKETVIKLVQEDDMDDDQLQRHIDHMTSGPCVLLSLQRENAVKKLLDLIGPKDPLAARRQSQFLWRGVFGADSVLNAFHVSPNYVSGVVEQNNFFPDGLCCENNEDLKSENIICPAVDSIVDLKYQDHRSLTIEDQTDDIDSPRLLLLQTTCIVLKPALSKCLIRGHLASIDIIEGLLNNGFELVGSRMIWFNKEQAEHFLHLIHAGSFAQVPTLVSGPSIVLALQRDNAVISFDSYLGSNYGSESLIGKYGENIIRPTDFKLAQKMLLFFFDELMPGSQPRIVTKAGKSSSDCGESHKVKLGL